MHKGYNIYRYKYIKIYNIYIYIFKEINICTKYKYIIILDERCLFWVNYGLK